MIIKHFGGSLTLLMTRQNKLVVYTCSRLHFRYDLQGICIEDVNLNWIPAYFANGCDNEGKIGSEFRGFVTTIQNLHKIIP